MVQGLMFIPNAEFFNVNNTPNLPSPYLNGTFSCKKRVCPFSQIVDLLLQERKAKYDFY